MGLLLLPTILSTVYYGGIATDRYASDARFLLRTGGKAVGMGGGLGAFLQMIGIARSQDDAHAVREFLTSRDAVRQLQDRLPVARMFGGADVDFLSRYPSILFNSSQEGLHRYLQNRLAVSVNPTNGIETLRVEAFHPEDAKAIAMTLLELGEELVNRLNERIRQDAVRVAEREVAVARERQVTTQIALTAFRNRELMLDPSSNALIVVQLIDRLYSQLAETRTGIAEMQAGSQRSPQLAGLQTRAAALEEQIAHERRRIASTSDGLAEKIAEYERLDLDHDFATRALVTALASLEIARAEARRQQLFLVRVVEPGLADEAREPRRLQTIFTVFGLNLVAVGMAWLIFSGLRQHVAYRGD